MIRWGKGGGGKGVLQDLKAYSKDMVKTLPFMESETGSIGEF